MGDSQDHSNEAEDGVVAGATPSVAPADSASADIAQQPAVDGTLRFDEVDSSGLTGVLAALDEPEIEAVTVQSEVKTADVEPADSFGVIVDPEPADPALAALQAELESADEQGEVVEPEEADASDGVTQEIAQAESAPSESLDDIAPGTVGDEQDASEDSKDIVLPDDRAGVPIWPFLVYFALWVIFAGLLVWQFIQAPAGTPIYELQVYGISILAGMVLTAIGPLLAVAVWLAVWLGRPRGYRAGLFSRSLIIGAVTTLAGVTLWLIALGAVDMLRLGRIL